MSLDELAQLPFVFDVGPQRFRVEAAAGSLRDVERTPAPNPAFDEIRVNLARFLKWEISLVDAALSLSAEAHLLLERCRSEQLLGCAVDLVVEVRTHTVAGQHGEADLL